MKQRLIGGLLMVTSLALGYAMEGDMSVDQESVFGGRRLTLLSGQETSGEESQGSLLLSPSAPPTRVASPYVRPDEPFEPELTLPEAEKWKDEWQLVESDDGGDEGGGSQRREKKISTHRNKRTKKGHPRHSLPFRESRSSTATAPIFMFPPLTRGVHGEGIDALSLPGPHWDFSSGPNFGAQREGPTEVTYDQGGASFYQPPFF